MSFKRDVFQFYATIHNMNDMSLPYVKTFVLIGDLNEMGIKVAQHLTYRIFVAVSDANSS